MWWLLLVLLLISTGLFFWGIRVRNRLLETEATLEETRKKYSALLEKAKSIESAAKQYKTKAEQLHTLAQQYQTRIETLAKFQPIADIHQAIQDLEQKKILVNAEITEAQKQRDAEIEKGKEDAMVLRRQGQEESLAIIERAKQTANMIEHQAHQEAKKIAGQAYDVMINESKAKREIQAIENKINGYGDEYLVPGISVLDELAELWEHKEAGRQLKDCRNKTKDMVKNGMAALCDYSEARRQQTAIQFVIDAFNGRVDAILSRVWHDNFGKLRQEILDVFIIVNRNGEAFRNARITDSYLNLRLDELKWAVAVYELKKQDQEEQRQIRDAMKEEERVLKEIEKAKKEAEKESKLLENAMAEAEAKLKDAHDDQRAIYEAELARLRQQLQEAEEKGQRAISLAEQTKRGHVYVISNIGSFGESIYKIGLTRRLEPLDRVRELGDASVPFSFDVHAMIYSEDAPTPEDTLHKRFSDQRLNRINLRKEFFSVRLEEIRKATEEIRKDTGELGVETLWTMRAEAAEYRESLALAKKEQSSVQSTS